MIPNHCLQECEYLLSAYNLFDKAAVDKTYLHELNIWIGASTRDNTSVQMKNLYSCVLRKLGVNILDNDFDAILTGRVKYDILLMFTFTPGTSARAIEIAVTSSLRKSYAKDKLYVYMPSEYSDGYISRNLDHHIIGKLFFRKKLHFERLDKAIFSKCVGHLINYETRKRDEMEVTFNPTILIVTALPLEFDMMVELLENEREDRSFGDKKSQYPHGKIGKHDVVIAMSSMGNSFSALIATIALEKYHSIKYIFMTGIAGGIPNIENANEHVRLGDIVICNNKGVVQHDMGKNITKPKKTFLKWFNSKNEEFEYNFSPRPPDSTLLRNTEIHVQRTGTNEYEFWKHLDGLLAKKNHVRPEVMSLCDTPWINGSEVEQPSVPNGFDQTRPRIHFGVIASGNTVVKSAKVRDKLKIDFKAKAIEMEASGVSDAAWIQGKDYFIVRGICDYSNSDKNKIWQPYAAAVAATFTKDIIERL